MTAIYMPPRLPGTQLQVAALEETCDMAKNLAKAQLHRNNHSVILWRYLAGELLADIDDYFGRSAAIHARGMFQTVLQRTLNSDG